ncbi:MAG: hypothetical protein AAGH64_09250 [Planctomycetota bacterium]
MACGPRCRTGPEFDPDFEGPSEADVARFSADWVTCPNCSSDVYDEATICPTCGVHMGDTAGLSDKNGIPPAVLAALAIVVVGAIILVAMS